MPVSNIMEGEFLKYAHVASQDTQNKGYRQKIKTYDTLFYHPKYMKLCIN